jgi:hypothetical protein
MENKVESTAVPASLNLIRTIKAARIVGRAYEEWAIMKYPEESYIPNLKEGGQWGDLNSVDGWCRGRLVDAADGHQGQGCAGS